MSETTPTQESDDLERAVKLFADPDRDTRIAALELCWPMLLPRIVSYAAWFFRTTHTDVIVSDISSDTGYKMVKRISNGPVNFDNFKACRQFVKETAKNTCLDYIKERGMISLDGLLAVGYDIRVQINGQQAAIDIDDLLELHRELQEATYLSPYEREIIYHHDLQGLPFPDIAAKYEKSSEAVRKSYERAIEKMRVYVALGNSTTLTESERKVLVLRLNGQTFEKISKRLGLSAVRVREAHRNALLKLGKKK